MNDNHDSSDAAQDKPKRRRPLVKTKVPQRRTGKARKARRRDRKTTEAETRAKEAAESQDRWEGNRSDQALLRRAINKRWLTDMTAEETAEVLRTEGVQLKPLAMAIIRKGLLNDDIKVALMATNNLLRAEGQNQADEHKRQPDKLDVSLSGSPEERVQSILERIEADLARQKANGKAGKRG